MIAVVDDDVSFAEEIQELLATSGHRSVVVVTHPQSSSLSLLRDAQLLILDLTLATTNALDVLEELRSRGSNPPVVMVSGSGVESLEAARSHAVDRGFSIVGALSKPVAAAELLGLLSGKTRPQSPPEVRPGGAPVPPCGHILVSSSLDYAGSHLGQCSLPDPGTDAERWLGRLAGTQRALAERGHEGFVIAPLPTEALADQDTLVSLGRSLAQAARSRIVFELGSAACVDPWAHADTLAALRIAGYGILLRFGDVDPPAALASLPVTMAAVDAGVPRDALGMPRLAEPLRRTIDYLRGRSIASLCIGIRTPTDLRHARAFGFNLVSAAPCDGLS